jgi:hypothetical protein
VTAKPNSPPHQNFTQSFDSWHTITQIPLLLLLTFVVSFLALHSCGLDVEDPTSPSPPQWVQKSLPEEWPERGIDAFEGGGIYLEWEPNQSNENIEKYHIYRAEYFDMSDSLGHYELQASIQENTVMNFEFVDHETYIYKQYSYKLAAEDYSQNIGPFSDSLSYELLPSIKSGQMTPNGESSQLGGNRTLTWVYSFTIMMENYCITIINNDSIVTRQMIAPQNYTGGFESWIIPNSIVLIPGVRYKWRVDMGAQYHNLRESSGSESSWATFLYLEQ